jgi:two-component system chemotaxis sensor kinase CheA
MPDSRAPEELLSLYVEEARVHLAALDRCLLDLERGGKAASLVQSVLGPLHTLKGNSGMIGFAGVKDYVHRLEDVFARIGEGALQLDAEAFDRLFAGASALRDAVEQAGGAGVEVRDLGPEQAELDAFLVRHQAGWREGSGIARSVPTSAPAPRKDATLPSALPRSSAVRVDFGQLDHLLNLVGELIIHRTKLDELGRRLLPFVGEREAGHELVEAVDRLAGVSAELQATVMDIRMLPVRHVFERFPRMVRDLARQQGKQIDLVLEGDATRVDKAIIDEIGEPLVHLVRNSVDHGIETPAVRTARGKAPTGTILLSAAQESSHVVITVVDDGAGIDPARVRTAAVERGLLRGDETLSDREAVQLVFAPGFSTKDGVSDVSGRGVGLDVVLQSIERLSGVVEIESAPGVGTRFTIQLPLTLAIISALLVEVAGDTYALPQAAVIECLRLSPDEIHTIGGRETLRLRDRVIPLVRLRSLLGRAGAGPGDYTVILGRGEKRIGVVVEKLQGRQPVVIKAIDPAVLGHASPVAGATITGGGRVVLILDVPALFDTKRHTVVSGPAEPRAPREVAH